jgi:hypothetical protein
MIAFLKAYFGNWLSAMSGIVSVLLWDLSAILTPLDVPVAVHIGFIIGAAMSMLFASYWVWSKTNADSNKAIADASNKQADRETYWSDKYQSLEKRTKELEERLNSDPSRQAIRLELGQFIDVFDGARKAAAKGEEVEAHIFQFDNQVRHYIGYHIPEYRSYEDNIGVRGAWKEGYLLKPDEALSLCEDRLSQLRMIQNWY